MGSKNKSKQQSNSQQASTNQNVSSGMGVNFGVNQSGQQSSSGSSNFNQSSQDVWGAQAPHLENVYGSATDQYGQAIDQINGMQPMVQDQVNQAASQGMAGNQAQLGGGFASGLQGQVGPNSYVNALKGDMMNDANLIKQQNLGGIDARAAASGMSGSSGYHNSANTMANNVDKATLQGMNNLGFQAHNQGVQNQMNLANMMDRNQQFGVGQTGAMQGAAMNQFNPAMAGLNATGAYGQIIGGPTVLGQSSGGGSSSSNSSGFSNGMNVGMNTSQSGGFGNSAGGSSGSGSSSGWSFDPGGAMTGMGGIMAASDIRLKENIKHVEQVDGVNLYTWDWKDDAPVTSDMNYGVIAQDVVNSHPDAVSTGDHGYMMVDYSKLGRAGELAVARMGV